VESEVSTPKNYILRDIPADLWRQVKVEAATEGVSVREVILRALRDYAGVLVSEVQPGIYVADTSTSVFQRPTTKHDLAGIVAGLNTQSRRPK
jgi:hypothetical protein